MTTKPKDRQSVYAIFRYDGFHGADAPPETTITVKEIVRSYELASAEVNRLNALNGNKDVRYWCQYTRLSPEGSGAGTEIDQAGLI